MNGRCDDASPPPALSFLCSAYRTEDYLAETIESVLAQTRPDWQLVIVDNGRDDAIARIVHTYLHDPRITLVRQDNRGISGGVNTAAAHATGRYLAVLHSDDLVTPDFCDRMAGILDTHPEIDAVGSDVDRFTAENGIEDRPVHPRNLPAHEDPDGRELALVEVLDGVMPHYSGAFRREAWSAAGGYTVDEPNVEDLYLWLRLLTDGSRVFVVPDRLGRYRVRADSVSYDQSSVEQVEATRERVLAAAAARCPTPHHAAALRRELRRGRHQRATRRFRWAMQDGDLRAARREAVAAFRARPTARGAVAVAGVLVAPKYFAMLDSARRRRDTGTLVREHGATT